MKSAHKSAVIIGAALLGALLFLYIFRLVAWRFSDEYAASQTLKNLTARYEEDSYGGYLPEETLRLFIEALNKGDADLASKFFIIEKQAEWKTALSNWKDKNKFASIVSVLDRAGHGREVAEGIYQMVVTNDANEALFLIDFVKNDATQKWKIERF